MHRFTKHLLLSLVLSGLLYWGGSFQAVAQAQERLFSFSFTVQDMVRGAALNMKQLFARVIPLKRAVDYRAEYFDLLKEITRLKELERENQMLKALVSLQEGEREIVNTSVVSRNLSGELFVRGYGDGRSLSRHIKVGAPVLNEHLFLVGLVTEVKEDSVKVKTLTAPGIEFNVSVFEGKTIGVARTSGLGNIEVNFVDPQLSVGEGELVFTAGGDGIFPKSLLLGRIVGVEKTGYFKKLRVEPLSDFGESTLLVIK